MPNIKSAKKRVKVGAVKRSQNQVVKTQMRTSIKKVKVAVAAGDQELTTSLFNQAVGSIDKAARKGVIHKNNAANKKSGIARLVNSIAQ